MTNQNWEFSSSITQAYTSKISSLLHVSDPCHGRVSHRCLHSERQRPWRPVSCHPWSRGCRNGRKYRRGSDQVQTRYTDKIGVVVLFSCEQNFVVVTRKEVCHSHSQFLKTFQLYFNPLFLSSKFLAWRGVVWGQAHLLISIVVHMLTYANVTKMQL